MCGSFTLSDVSTAAEDEDSNNDGELGAFSLDGDFSPAQSVAGDPTDDEHEGDYELGTELFQYELVGFDDEGDEGSNDAPPEAMSAQLAVKGGSSRGISEGGRSRRFDGCGREGSIWEAPFRLRPFSARTPSAEGVYTRDPHLCIKQAFFLELNLFYVN